MFERFTEKARRTIFFARYEASVLGSPSIENEHMLLGILREDHAFAATLGVPQPLEALRAEVEAAYGVGQKIPTSVDLPVGNPAQRGLAFAAEEAEALGHEEITVGHLVIGLMRVPGLATDFLVRRGLSIEKQREAVRKALAEESQPAPPVGRGTLVRAYEGPLPGPMNTLTRLMESGLLGLEPGQRLKRKSWTRAEALGHLINLAVVHHEWLARALAEQQLTAAAYPPEEWVAAQHYNDYSWAESVELWISLNRFLVHLVGRLTEQKLSVKCRIGIAEPVTLAALVQRYVAEVEDLMGQILAKL